VLKGIGVASQHHARGVSRETGRSYNCDTSHISLEVLAEFGIGVVLISRHGKLRERLAYRAQTLYRNSVGGLSSHPERLATPEAIFASYFMAHVKTAACDQISGWAAVSFQKSVVAFMVSTNLSKAAGFTR